MTDAVIEERGIFVTMRDGIRLAADVWRPDVDHSVPVLVGRTPYSKAMAEIVSFPKKLALAGFAVVLQDCRGRFDSEGEWGYLSCEVDDGYDTVEWAAVQPWSNGRVGMFGASYMANTQWLAAIGRPPHLDALAVEACAADHWSASFGTDGAFRLSLRMSWTALIVSAMAEQWGLDDELLSQLRAAFKAQSRAAAAGDRAKILAAKATTRLLLEDVYRFRPIRDNELLSSRTAWLGDIFDHEARGDSHWRLFNPSTYYAALDLPTVHVGGWYDIHLDGVLRNFTGMSKQAPSELTRSAQRLIVGPWSHWTPSMTKVGEVDFGADARIDMTEIQLRWFNTWLRDEEAQVSAPVRIFVMGPNVWRDEEQWPLARTQYTPWYMNSDGTLLPERRTIGNGTAHFDFDPSDPAPTIGGRLLGLGEVAGPFDQSPLDARRDVLTFTSATLSEPMEITGPVMVELWASSDVPDTDFTAILADVSPDGRVLNLCEGAVRARHQLDGPMTMDAIYRFRVDLVATSAVIAIGHALRVYVSSSSFPEWEPNPNTGHGIGVDGVSELRIAHQRVHFDSAHPSHIILPIIPD